MKTTLALQLQLTIMDFVDQCHNTHHPVDISGYYEDQKEGAKRYSSHFRAARMPKFLNYFEATLEKAGGCFLLSKLLCRSLDVYGESHFVQRVFDIELCFLQLLRGPEFAVPKRMAALKPSIPLLYALKESVEKRKNVAAYLSSDRCQPFEGGIFRHYEELDGEE